MADAWTLIREWPELVLERHEDAGVARIVLNRPQKRNALNPPLVKAMLASLDLIRADDRIKVVVTKGNGPTYCAGLDLHFLREVSEGPPRDWDRPTLTVQLFEALRNFPRVTIAQVHGYCLGGGLALLNMHDLVVAATTARLGMPEILRGSFGQMATSTLFHAQIPIKKAALIQLTGGNVSGDEADRLGLVSMAVPEEELENSTIELAREIATRALAPLQHAKIAAQMGRDLTLQQAMQLDQLVGARQRLAIDPLAHVDEYLRSQSGGPNPDYRRSDA